MQSPSGRSRRRCVRGFTETVPEKERRGESRSVSRMPPSLLGGALAPDPHSPRVAHPMHMQKKVFDFCINGPIGHGNKLFSGDRRTSEW